MEMNQPSSRLHPLMAGAAVSVMLVSLLGVAAMLGVIPNSNGTTAPTVAAAPAITAAPAASAVPASKAATVQSAEYAPTPETAPAPAKPRKHVVHHAPMVRSQPAAEYAQSAPVQQQSAPAPAPVAQNSAVGIGVGAVVGGLLGNQVGKGNGRTLATIAGAVGGGYLGNEVAKRTP
jgi:uncharacterized protein YcfJ